MAWPGRCQPALPGQAGPRGNIGRPSTPAARRHRPHAAASQGAGESGGGVWRARAAAATMAPTHEGHPPGTRTGHSGRGRPSLLTMPWLLSCPLCRWSWPGWRAAGRGRWAATSQPAAHALAGRRLVAAGGATGLSGAVVAVVVVGQLGGRGRGLGPGPAGLRGRWVDGHHMLLTVSLHTPTTTTTTGRAITVHHYTTTWPPTLRRALLHLLLVPHTPPAPPRLLPRPRCHPHCCRPRPAGGAGVRAW